MWGDFRLGACRYVHGRSPIQKFQVPGSNGSSTRTISIKWLIAIMIQVQFSNWRSHWPIPMNRCGRFCSAVRSVTLSGDRTGRPASLVSADWRRWMDHINSFSASKRVDRAMQNSIVLKTIAYRLAYAKRCQPRPCYSYPGIAWQDQCGLHIGWYINFTRRTLPSGGHSS